MTMLCFLSMCTHSAAADAGAIARADAWADAWAEPRALGRERPVVPALGHLLLCVPAPLGEGGAHLGRDLELTRIHLCRRGAEQSEADAVRD